MNIKSIFGTIVIANFIGSTIFALSTSHIIASQSWQLLTWFAVGASLVSLAIIAAVNGLGFLKIKQSIQTISDQTNSDKQEFKNTGVVELDEIGIQIARRNQETELTSLAELQELAEIKSLLQDLDRRSGAFDRNGQPYNCASRLRSILKGYGGELDSGIRQAISCGHEIKRAAEEIVTGAEAQSDSVKRTASFIEDISADLISVSDSSSDAIEASKTAQKSVTNGLQQFHDLTAEMKQVRNHAAARERKLQALGKHMKQIETIVQTIGSLSSRTDLLALNASIESVRAGEHGRGFAVVAEEVRALAEQSAKAVVDITNRIEMIQLETQQSMTIATGEHDQMHQVIKRITDTQEFLQTVADASFQSANCLGQISESTNRQLQLAQNVIETLERSSETSKKNRGRAEGALWTAKTLGQIGSQLESSLDVFRSAGVLSKQSTPTVNEESGELSASYQPQTAAT